LSDFFDFMFTALPHKILQAEKFESEAEQLRQRFIDPAHGKFVFQPQYHKKIPADGFQIYMESIWVTSFFTRFQLIVCFVVQNYREQRSGSSNTTAIACSIPL
jgi:hypothetical protein